MSSKESGFRLASIIASLSLLLAASAWAGEKSVKIGVLTDFNGYASSTGGKGSVVAAQMAIDDVGGKAADKSIELVSGDMQSKPDVASAIAREWFDQQGVDAIADLPVSSVGLAVQAVARERHKVLIPTGSLTTDLTGKECSPWTIHFADDTSALPAGTVRALVAKGLKTWFFITADFAFGHALERDATKFIEAAGGQVVGGVHPPMETHDFSSFIVAAQTSKAQVVALANASIDTINSIKAANEFGLTRGGQQLAALLVYLSDIHSLGLKTAQGLYVTSGFYWDENAETRAFGKRFMAQYGSMPTKEQANVYAGVFNYLKAIQDIGSDAPDKVMARLKSVKLAYFGKEASLRADGRVLYDLALYQVKSPEESKYPWDYYKKIADVPANEAFLPLEAGHCPFLANAK